MTPSRMALALSILLAVAGTRLPLRDEGPGDSPARLPGLGHLPHEEDPLRSLVPVRRPGALNAAAA